MAIDNYSGWHIIGQNKRKDEDEYVPDDGIESRRNAVKDLPETMEPNGPPSRKVNAEASNRCRVAPVTGLEYKPIWPYSKE